MPLHLDFSDTKDLEAPVPGTYNVRIRKIEQKMSQASNNPFLAWELEILQAPYEGVPLFYNTSLQTKALFSLRQALVALGYDKEELKGAIEIDPVDLVGMECCAVVTLEDYQGTARARVKRLLAPGAAAQAVAAPAAATQDAEEIPF